MLFNKGELDVWVPAVYPVLLYLFGRLLLAGFRPRERAGPLIPFARETWLLAGLALLLIGRLGAQRRRLRRDRRRLHERDRRRRACSTARI